ncbi:TetR/AcrR family transcriptional regulator [Proteiniclasticum sp.]|uniref:TetR/AcrR family transcriptional regulator n=1 Tax=Proteiniclasticum sp. TaxID=2053595 RepID=UPI002899EDCD|nr:TetR/AcrR family transcriptional regulator [Proteiniclasticum sp.]
MMKREEKNSKTREQILKSAMKEFGEKSYSEASLNTISKDGEISKGIIYHYFKDKDDLYLSCVYRCVSSLVEYLREKENLSGEPEKDIKRYLELRHRYFEGNPDGMGLFSSFMLHPPKHLMEEISKLREELDVYNRKLFERILEGVHLREEVSLAEAMEFFLMFQESFNYYFSQNYHGEENEAFNQHEQKLKKFLPLLFHGITKE